MNRRQFLKVLGLGAGSVVVARAIGKQLPAPLPIPVRKLRPQPEQDWVGLKAGGETEMVVTYGFGVPEDWITISSDSPALNPKTKEAV